MYVNPSSPAARNSSPARHSWHGMTDVTQGSGRQGARTRPSTLHPRAMHLESSPIARVKHASRGNSTGTGHQLEAGRHQRRKSLAAECCEGGMNIATSDQLGEDTIAALLNVLILTFVPKCWSSAVYRVSTCVLIPAQSAICIPWNGYVREIKISILGLELPLRAGKSVVIGRKYELWTHDTRAQVARSNIQHYILAVCPHRSAKICFIRCSNGCNIAGGEISESLLSASPRRPPHDITLRIRHSSASRPVSLDRAPTSKCDSSARFESPHGSLKL